MTIVQSALQIELEICRIYPLLLPAMIARTDQAPQLSNKALFHRHEMNLWCNVTASFADLRHRPLGGLLHCSIELLEYVATQQEAQCNQQGFTNISS